MIARMAVRLVQIHMKAADEEAAGRFWAEVLGWGVSSDEPGLVSLEPGGLPYPDPTAMYIDIAREPKPKTVKNRVHVDLAHQPGLVERLRDLGATPVDIGQGE